MKHWILESRIHVLVGHYGSGKTEVALNMAEVLGKHGQLFAMVDLDVVNPYFRSRECREMVEGGGGRIVASSQACTDADISSVPAEVRAIFDDRNQRGILDVGGDPSGARVLAGYRTMIEREKARVVCVINASRPLTGTADAAVRYIREIEAACGLKVGGIIHNTHLCNQTTIEAIRDGIRMAERVGRITGIPVICHSVEEKFAKEVGVSRHKLLLLQLYMKKPWERRD